MIKHHDQKQLKEKAFILASISKGIRVHHAQKAWCGSRSKTLAGYIVIQTQEVEPENRKWDEAINSSKPAPSDVLPLTRLQLLAVPQLSHRAPQTGDQMFRYMSPWGMFLIHTTIAAKLAGVLKGCAV